MVPCPKNFSAQSDPVSFCASDNKILVTCNYDVEVFPDTVKSFPNVCEERHLTPEEQSVSQVGESVRCF